MESSTIPIHELVKKAEIYLENQKYCTSTIRKYQVAWKKLLSYFTGCNSLNYFPGMFYTTTCQIYGITEEVKPTHNRILCIRAAKLLDELFQNKTVIRCYQPSGIRVSDCFSALLKSFVAAQIATEITQKTITSKSIQMTRFLNYLHDQGLTDVDLLTADLVLAYTSDLRNWYARNTVSGILFTLREFLHYLYVEGKTRKPYHQLFPIIYSDKKDRLPSYYYEDELQKILATINRNTVIGKRDYLILILATQLGIRAGDIRMLVFSNIHWEKNTIEFVQHKTGNPISLPLLENIKYALLEYVRDSRPESSSPYIFIRTRAPYEPYASNNVFHYVVTPCLKNAGIDFAGRKHGLHAMRHSLASNLLKNNTPYPVITGILGHENSTTTSLYLSIDIEELRSVALEVPNER